MHIINRRLVITTIVVGLFLQACIVCHARQETDRRVPGKEEQTEAINIIKELFRSSYENRSPELAQQLLKTADQTADRVELYVLLDQTLKIAVYTGNVELAWTATERLGESYEVDKFALKYDLLEELPGRINSADGLEKLFFKSQQYLNSLVATDDYEFAEKFATKISTIARKAKSSGWQKSFKELSKQIKLTAKAFARVKNALQQLKNKPDDSTANQLVGEYYCFTKNNFELGLPYLAKGNNQTTLDLASREVEEAISVGQIVELADKWKEFGTDLENKYAIERARHHFERGYKVATGLEKKRIATKLSETNKDLFGDIGYIIGKKWNVKWKNGHPSWDVAEFFSDGRSEMLSQGKNWKNRFTVADNMLHIVGHDEKNTFIIALHDQHLACQKIDNSTGRVIDQAIGKLIKP